MCSHSARSGCLSVAMGVAEPFDCRSPHVRVAARKCHDATTQERSTTLDLAITASILARLVQQRNVLGIDQLFWREPIEEGSSRISVIIYSYWCCVRTA
jgi:hypothetical protein